MTSWTDPSTSAHTVVLIHGVWLTARSWEHWVERFERRGHRVLAPNWPGLEAEVESVNADPSTLTSLTVEQVIDHYESIVLGVERPPIIIGHSIGGTITRILLERGLGAAGVAVASTSVAGTPDLLLSTINHPSPDPSTSGEPRSLTPQEFHHAFANTVSREQSNALYVRYAVPAPAGVLKAQAFAGFQRSGPTVADARREPRAPLLLICFGDDHVIPCRLACATDAEIDDSHAVTESREFPGRPHFPGAPGWEDVADLALAWAVRHASASRPNADASGDRVVYGGSS